MPTAQELYVQRSGARNNPETAPTVNVIGEVLQIIAAQQQRGNNTAAYAKYDSYGGVGTFTGLSNGCSFLLQSFELQINIAAIPSGMSLSVLFFDSLNNAQSSGAFIADNALLTNVSFSSFGDSRGYPLSLTVDDGKVIAYTDDINRLFRLAPGQTTLYFYIRVNAAFTPAAVSETMNGKAVLGTY
jgi:hypothetical protein